MTCESLKGAAICADMVANGFTPDPSDEEERAKALGEWKAPKKPKKPKKQKTNVPPPPKAPPSKEEEEQEEEEQEEEEEEEEEDRRLEMVSVTTSQESHMPADGQTAKRIYLTLRGRLANQLFQVASMWGIAEVGG